MEDRVKRIVLKAQRNEITEYYIYLWLSKVSKDVRNKNVLKRIAREEKKHYEFLKKFTGRDVSPKRYKIGLYLFLSKLLGLNFSLKLMEQGEDFAKGVYEEMKSIIPQFEDIFQDEHNHEMEILEMLEEERLKYIGSIVLGLNDALVELTAALAGLTLAFQKTRLVAVVGVITGIAAAMSMAASEYLSVRQERMGRNPLRASVYTGVAYIFTVMLLILPYFVVKNVFLAFGCVLIIAVVIIFFFNFYISVAGGLSFKKRFVEMAVLSLSIALVNFLLGMGIRKWFGIEM